jgi:hypothetical protein
VFFKFAGREPTDRDNDASRQLKRHLQADMDNPGNLALIGRLQRAVDQGATTWGTLTREAERCAWEGARNRIAIFIHRARKIGVRV